MAVGGDSCLRVRNGSLEILPYREGPAYCLGGPQPTPTDAMRVAGLTDIGDKDKAIDAMKILGKDLGLSVNRTAELTLKMMVRRITAEINSMFWPGNRSRHTGSGNCGRKERCVPRTW